MNEIGKVLVIVGVIIAAVGALLWMGFGKGWFGRLPGDIQYTRAKGFDGSCPLGPWISTEVDPTDVTVETRLNGDVVQRGTTADMVFGVGTLIEYVTAFMTLLPGDVLLTGTPEGVGRLADGDVVEVEVEGVGVLRNPVVGP